MFVEVGSLNDSKNMHHEDTKAQIKDSKNLFIYLCVFVPLWFNLFFDFSVV
jgi:hypothetical protein